MIFSKNNNQDFFAMGSWKLEVGRMAVYIMFPVVMFHYFNQPKYFEEWVIKTKRELYPPDSDQVELKEALRKIKEQQEIAYMKTLEGK